MIRRQYSVSCSKQRTHRPLPQFLVPTARLELAQLAPLPPQDSVSTNFTTSAYIFVHLARTWTRQSHLRYFGISFAFDAASAAPTGASPPTFAGCETDSDCTASCITLPVVFGL